jgi:hypothetical protein
MISLTRRVRWIALLCVCIPGMLAPAGIAQQQSAPGKTADAKSSDVKTEQTTPKTPLTPEEKKREDLRADTEKLYQLTKELQVEVAKSNKDTLSVSVIKKAQEIERLAKSIKERTRNQ